MQATPMFSRDALDAASDLVHRHIAPTPHYAWPLLAERLGTELWVKHENHTPCGAFKMRGGLVYLDELARAEPDCPGIVTATRGNHGQSIPYAARAYGIPVTVLVPKGNSVEKNAAMRAWGARLEVFGEDFEEARQEAVRRGEDEGLHIVGPFHEPLVRGVATYALELLSALPDLDVVYVPIGMGSGICGLITVRDLLGLKTDIVGVVSAGADAYAQSFEAGRVVATNTTLARDGVKSAHRHEAGGLSGQPLFVASTRVLARLSGLTDVPLVGVGGVGSAEQAYAKIRAGASAVQLYTALVYEGISLAGRIAEGLDRLLARDGFGSVAEAVRTDRDRWL